LVGNKNIWCFIINILACVLWIIYALFICSEVVWGLLILCGVSIIMNIRNFIKWRKSNGKKEK